MIGRHSASAVHIRRGKSSGIVSTLAFLLFTYLLYRFLFGPAG